MTNRRKEILLRYCTERDRTIKEVPISEDDTPQSVLLKLKAESNFHLTDEGGHPFAMDDWLFGYCSFAANPTLKLLHGSALMARKTRTKSVKKDNRIATELRFRDEKAVFARGVQPSYAKATADAISNFGITDPCFIERVRAEDDRIIIEFATGIDSPWFTEKACPPMKLSDDRLYQESTGVGGWGSVPPPNPMMTRARTVAVRKVKLVEVLLHNLVSDEMEKVGEADNYDQAIALARRSGKVPEGWNVAVAEANDERMIVVCKKGATVSGDGVTPAVTTPKPKAKKTPILPEKLVGKNPEAIFAPKSPVPDVPGVLNAMVEPHHFKLCKVRPIDPAQGSWHIKVETLGGPTSEIEVRKDVYMMELLALAYQGTDFAEGEKVKMVLKPLRMEDGAVFKIERVFLTARLALSIQIWDGSSRHCGIEVVPTATGAEIADQAQRRIGDEPLEEARYYNVFYRNQPASPPWIQKEYELRPDVDISGTVIVRNRNGDMTVPVPLLQKNRWQQLAYDSMPDPPLTITQIGPLEFRAIYADEEVLCHVRLVTDAEGEEHVISLLPFWDNQRLKIAEAFGREMAPDTSRQSRDNVIFVKSADGSPPDPTFERILTYTLGNDPAEYSVRVHKGETTRDIKGGLARLHAGINPAKILFEGSEMDDADAITDWASATGTSPIRVQVTLDTPMQKFWLWQHSGQYDLGSEDLDGRSKDEIWRALQVRNPMMKNFKDYCMFKGQDEVLWENLPVLDMVLVPIDIPVIN
jgi:hypothetical protein